MVGVSEKSWRDAAQQAVIAYVSEPARIEK
jgi:hypothetical protein